MSKSLNEIISNVIISMFFSILIFNIPTLIVKVQAKDIKGINKEYERKYKFNNIANITQHKHNILNFNNRIKNNNKRYNLKTHHKVNIVLDEIQNSIKIEKLEKDHKFKRNNAKNQIILNNVKDNYNQSKQQLQQNKDNEFKIISSILGAIMIGLILVMIYEKTKQNKD